MTIYTWITLASTLAFVLLPTPSSKIGLLEAAILALPAAIWSLRKKDWHKPPKLPRLAYPVLICIAAYLGRCFFLNWSKKTEVIALASRLHLSAALIVLIIAVGMAVFSLWFLGHLFFTIRQTFQNGAGKRNALCIFLSAAAGVIMSQIMIETDPLAMGLFKFLLGTLAVAVVILLIYCLSGRLRLSLILATVFFQILSTANGYVYSFRGRLLDPLDIFSLGTAMNVAESYSLFPIPTGVALGWILWFAGVFLLFRLPLKTEARPGGKARVRMGLGALAGILVLTCYCLPLKVYHWDKQGAEYNGFILNFTANLKEVYVAKPKGYSPEAIEELSLKYETPEAQADTPPHIIVIMDESFADLSVFGDLPTNIDPMPYVSSLMESTLSGYALASVYGGNTANSEFELLTGNSMAWLSPNAVPYQQYLNSPTYSMVSYLKSACNYRCVAMHPYLANGWNRPGAYENLGFDECFFLDAFPQEDLIREYVSDREMFEKLIEIYEDRKDAPLFLFGVSMQNHGGYSYNYDNFTQSVYLEGFETPYPRGDQYLSLIYETDKAVEYLISYFSSVEEDVVILFFGDHQPRLDKEFYAQFPETYSDSLDDQQRKYLVPFFIWANYPLEAEQVECTSLNYLSTYLYEAAGIPLPGYNQFLAEMEQVIPAINTNGYYSLSAQCYLPLDEATGEEKAWLQLYQQLQYNNLFDDEHHNGELFPLLP